MTIVKAGRGHGELVMDLKREYQALGEPMVGCGSLERAESVEAWLRRDEMSDLCYGGPCVYLALDAETGALIGTLELWTFQSAYVRNKKGNITFAVRPSERGKGCAAEMLEKMVGICWTMGCDRLVLLCDRDDRISDRVIRACGGQPEEELLPDPDRPGEGFLRRYWLETREVEMDDPGPDQDFLAQSWYGDGWKPGESWF